VKSYISRKLPLATRTTFFTASRRSADEPIRAALNGDPSPADVAEIAAAAAVAHVLQLDRDAVGIGEVELGRAAGRAAAVLHPHADVRLERRRRARRVAARGDAVALEGLEDLVGVEAFQVHAHVVDARRPRRRGVGSTACGAGATGEHQELD